jgi:hypothetical protein
MKKLAMILGAALVAVSIVAVNLWMELDKSRHQVADLQAGQPMMAAAAPVTAAIPTVQTQPATAAATQVECPAPAAPAGTQQAGAQRQNSGLLEGAKQILSSEQGRAMVQPAVRGMIQQQFKGVGKALNLSTEEEEKLIDTIARQQTELSAASMELLTASDLDAGKRQELQRNVQEMQRADEAELSSKLGSNYPQLQEFGSTMAVRQQVDQLNTLLAPSGAGLSDAESKSLVAALAAEQKRITQEANANPVPAGSSRQDALNAQLQRTTDANRRLVNTASGYLSSVQLESYKKLLDQQAQMVRAALGAMGAGQ